MDITFYGAAGGAVTGSCFKLSTSKGSIMVDCGLFQGPKEIKEKNYNEFDFNPAEIDVLVLTHAHIDHCGLIPKLCKKGFKGKIFATIATKDLCTIMLPDAAHIQEMEVERKNRKLERANKPLLEPIYTLEDVENCLEQFVGVKYDTKVEIIPGVWANFRDAGHILGSAIIELYVEEEKIVFSGDIGNLDQPIINDPTYIKEADYVVMESTYGNRFHLETEDKLVQLARVIKKTIKKGGNLVIPAFAIERTQEIIYDLRKLFSSNEVPPIDVYIDSPLAIKATEIFRKYPLLFDEEAVKLEKSEGSCLYFPTLKFSLTTEESIKLNNIKKNAIIISASGMADAGRIKYHLKYNLWRPECTILFVGYQAQGTLGRRILEGEKLVKIHGGEIAVNADIEKLEGFSAHADQKGLVEWVKNFSKKPKKIFIVHGEAESRETLAQVLKEETGISNIVTPNFNETFELTAEDVKVEKKQIGLEEKDSLMIAFSIFEDKLKELLKDEDKKKLIIQELDNIKEKLSNN